MTTRKLTVGLATYLALALLGALSLDGDIRLALWIFLAGLAVKTILAWLDWRRNP